MSHLIEEYAKSLGVKISKPIVAKHFWPIPTEKFITIALEPAVPAKKYKYFDTVLGIVSPYLKSVGISVVQIGSSKSGIIQGIDYSLVDLTFKQTAYVLSKSLLHISSDGVLSHYANSIGVPLVTLFGNVYSSVSKGFWSKNQELIEAPWTVKPSLSADDAEDSINKILPETIAKSVLKQLGIKNSLSHTTKFIGSMYHNPITEIVPNFFHPIQSLKGQHIFLRPDCAFDRNCFLQWCQFLDKFSIFFQQPIPFDFVKAYVSKITNLMFIAGPHSSFNEEYFAQVKALGVPFSILVPKKDDVAFMREKFFDYTVQWYTRSSREELKDRNIDFSKTFFRSSKITLGDGKQYASLYHFRQGKNFVDNSLPLEDNDALLEELQHFYIYE